MATWKTSDLCLNWECANTSTCQTPGAEGQCPTRRAGPLGRGLERGPGRAQCDNHGCVTTAFHTDLRGAPRVLPNPRSPGLGPTTVRADGSGGLTSPTQTCREFGPCVSPEAPCSAVEAAKETVHGLAPTPVPHTPALMGGAPAASVHAGSSPTVHASWRKHSEQPSVGLPYQQPAQTQNRDSLSPSHRPHKRKRISTCPTGTSLLYDKGCPRCWPGARTQAARPWASVCAWHPQTLASLAWWFLPALATLGRPIHGCGSVCSLRKQPCWPRSQRLLVPVAFGTCHWSDGPKPLGSPGLWV